MQRTGLGRMPHVASHVQDEAALRMLRAWIQGLDEKQAPTRRGSKPRACCQTCSR